MKICVVGAGAIGGLLAAKLAQSGNEVTVIARKAHLLAIRENGLKLIDEAGGESAVPLRATDVIGEAGAQDLVILGMKAHQVPPIVSQLSSLYHDTTVVMTAQNGIPWWYFMKQKGPHEGMHLESVDPGGVIARSLPVERVIGSIVYPAAEVIAPGIIRHIEGNRFSVGEIDDSDTARIRNISERLREAGFKAPVLSDIRSEIWTKLWGNLSLNPISALTHATLADICQFPPTRALLANMMREAQAVAEHLGIRFKVSLEKRIAGAEAVGQHKTSMLQDIEAGRPIELEALVGSVVELGRITQIPTPNINAIYAAAALLSHNMQTQKGVLRVQPAA
ncbi:MAG: 2-dehydropantoate 2-reductase [Burkholderiaceae bacterium]|jgi:2-dehydropantoate 2-reductase